MTTLEMLLMLVALTCGTMFCRFLPMIFPQALLVHPFLQKLNKLLPLAIMVLLLLTSLHFPAHQTGLRLFMAECCSLVLVLVSYRWWRNFLLSVGLGILCLNGFFALFSLI